MHPFAHPPFFGPEAYVEPPVFHPLDEQVCSNCNRKRMDMEMLCNMEHDVRHTTNLLEDIDGRMSPKIESSSESDPESAGNPDEPPLDRSIHSDGPSFRARCPPPLPEVSKDSSGCQRGSRNHRDRAKSTFSLKRLDKAELAGPSESFPETLFPLSVPLVPMVKAQTAVSQADARPDEVQKDDRSPRKRKGPEEEPDAEESEGERRAKQERNRVCARECRKRKKQYMETMEEQVKVLRTELAECRKELAVLRAKEQQGLFSQFSVLQYLDDMGKQFAASADRPAGNTKDILQKYIVFKNNKYG